MRPAVLGLLLLTPAAAAARDRPVSYGRDVRPILAENCFSCHGQDPNHRKTAAEATGCDHLDHIVGDVQRSVDRGACQAAAHLPPAERRAFVDGVARRNVDRAVGELRQSRALARLIREGRVAVVGAMYDVATGAVEFLADAEGAPPSP